MVMYADEASNMLVRAAVETRDKEVELVRARAGKDVQQWWGEILGMMEEEIRRFAEAERELVVIGAKDGDGRG
jgi:hypothetical protein